MKGEFAKMPNYVNPYMVGSAWNNAVNPYGGYGNVMPVAQQSYAPAPMQPPMSSNVIPVDGEVGAKAYMVPSGSTGPIALWDTNDNVIYLRTFNAAGMPNPLKKLRYVEEEPTSMLPQGQSGAASQIDTSQFVTKNDLENLRNEIRQMNSAMQQNGNRGVNALGNQGGSNIQNGSSKGR